MMKITVDTNVLISATFWYGDSNKIILLAEGKSVELILSKEIVEEYAEVLEYDEIKSKIKDKGLNAKYSLGKIISIAKIAIPKEKFDIIKDDKDDNKVIDAAVEGKVDYIVTSDRHLLDLKEFKRIKIITPKEFIGMIDKKLK